MRMMVSFSIPVEDGNEAVRSGTMGQLLREYMEENEPEAAYFTTDDGGERGGFFILDMEEPSEMIKLAEPLFLNLNARVTFKPVMTAEDVMSGVEEGELAESNA